MAQRLLVASNAAEALRRNIVEEQQLYNQFLNAVRTIMQPIQSAIAIVQVHPPPPSFCMQLSSTHMWHSGSHFMQSSCCNCTHLVTTVAV